MWRDILSTVGDVQYRGRYLEYHGVFSTVGDIMSSVGVILSMVGATQYRGGYHDAHGDIMNTVGVFRYHPL